MGANYGEVGDVDEDCVGESGILETLDTHEFPGWKTLPKWPQQDFVFLQRPSPMPEDTGIYRPFLFFQ